MDVLVLEASTTSAKAMRHTPGGGAEVVVRQLPFPDPSRHDADTLVEILFELGAGLAAGHEIAAVALGSAWHGTMLADQRMRPRTPIYQWSDLEAAELCRELRADAAFTRAFYQATGCMVHATYPYFALARFAELGQLGEARFFDAGGYLNYRLTGEYVTTRCLASGTGLLDLREREWRAAGLDRLGMDASQLPALVDSEDTFPLAAAAASRLGVRPGIPVVPANSDGGLNQVGVGALAPGVMTLSVGTSGAIRLSVPAPVLPEAPSTWCYLSPKGYLSGAATSGACSCVDWFRRALPGCPDYAELEPGPDAGPAPTFLPFVFGERCPGWDDTRTGGFVGILPGHDHRDLYAAVQEGVLFNLLQCYHELARLNGTPNRIKLSGGILNSPRWTQLAADVFGAPLEIDEVEHGSLLGGAALAYEALGLGAAADFAPPTARVVTPNPAAADACAAQYARYLKAYTDGQDAEKRHSARSRKIRNNNPEDPRTRSR